MINNTHGTPNSIAMVNNMSMFSAHSRPRDT